MVSNEVLKLEIKNGILIGTYLTPSINIQKAILAVQLRKEYTNGQDFPSLIRNVEVVSIDKEARDFFSSSEGIIGLKSGALIVNSIFQATLFNFFLKVSSPKLPTKVFTDEKKALKWLEQFVDK